MYRRDFLASYIVKIKKIRLKIQVRLYNLEVPSEREDCAILKCGWEQFIVQTSPNIWPFLGILNGVGSNFLCKIAQIFGHLLGILKTSSFK